MLYVVDVAQTIFQAGNILKGTLFRVLLVPVDRERFRSCLSVPSASGLCDVGQRSSRTFAGLCHVKLRHGLATALTVNLFFSSMALAAEQVSYLVGIQGRREDVEGHHDVPDAADGG